MLRISKKADYAVFLLGAIARQGAFPGGRHEDLVISAHEIARLCGLNKSVVANLLKEFARQEILVSVRGLRGGYRLARAPADISLREILEVVDGRFHLVECIGDHAPENGDARADDSSQPCSLSGICPSKSPLHAVHRRIGQLFDQTHLAELCGLEPPAAEHGANETPR